MNVNPLHLRIVTLALGLAVAVAIGLGPVAAGPAAAQGMKMDSPGGDAMKMDEPGSDAMKVDGSDQGGMNMMGDLDTSTIPRVPPVAGYADGERIFFVHTEVSDPEIGAVMTQMMGSPVPVVPALAGAPDSMLATVWAFTNGIKPEGPRGPLDFQPDVFDRPVGAEGYSPLRMLYLVTWADGTAARLLTSAAEVDAALTSNAVTIRRTGVVVNTPFLTWPGGQR